MTVMFFCCFFTLQNTLFRAERKHQHHHGRQNETGKYISKEEKHRLKYIDILSSKNTHYELQQTDFQCTVAALFNSSLYYPPHMPVDTCVCVCDCKSPAGFQSLPLSGPSTQHVCSRNKRDYWSMII